MEQTNKPKKYISISLANRLALTYTVFLILALALLGLVINIFTGVILTTLVKENIAKKSEEIAVMIQEQYISGMHNFNINTLEQIGMLFVHDGYIISVENADGELLWNARECAMAECMTTINDIARRMEKDFRVTGALRKDQYPMSAAGQYIGTVTIETYGPFFYSETEARFLTLINRLLVIVSTLIAASGILVSIALSRAIARPILLAARAARAIAIEHAGGAEKTQGQAVRIADNYKTRELAGLSRAINELARELEDAERRQKQLSADIAHELRSPLACLQGNIEAMLDGVYTPDSEHLESCHEEILRLAKLVHDLGTLTSLEWENIRLNKTEVDLVKLLRVTAGQFRQAARKKGVTIEFAAFSPQPVVNADYDRLKQVFINLMANAVYYTEKGSIKISIQAVEEKAAPPDCRWEVQIADTGEGIPEEDLPHIFERFYRSDKSRSRATGGAGIGLTIAAAIVHAHGGTISAANAAGENRHGGAVFTVRV